MAFWIRDANLTIGKKKYYLGGLDFTFEIPFEDTDEPPVATLTVKNLSENSRAEIKKNETIILNAGYEGDVGCILLGKVVGLKHKQSGVDWTTTITVQPCADQILNQKINKTYKAKTTAKTIVKDLLNIFGVEVGKCELTVNKTYSRGRVCKGKLLQVLTEIVVSECNSKLIIRDTGQIYVIKDGDGIDNSVILNTRSGLLRADEEQEVIPVESKSNSTKTGEDRDDEDLKSRACLLNYRIAAAEIVKIKSDDLNGTFIVKKGSHKGGNTGDWKTTMELKPYTQPAKKNAKKTAVSAAITGAVSRETLRFGSRGNAVKTLQETLGGLTVDGIFGQETRAAVKEFQEANGLTVDGIVGPQTWNALLGG